MLFLALVPLGIAPYLHRIYRKFGRFAPGPALVSGLVVLYACGLVTFTLFPLPRPGAVRCGPDEPQAHWLLEPFNNIAVAWELLLEHGAAALRMGSFLQVPLNALLFMPLGFFLVYLWGRSLPVATGIGLGVSLAIEITQGTALFGLYPCPYRFMETDDLIMNTLGASLGWLLGAAVLRWAPYQEPEPVPDLAVPSRRRRLGAVAVDVATWFGVTAVLQVFLVLFFRRTVDPQYILEAPLTNVLPAFLAVALLLAVPLVRADRATPGQWAVTLRPVRHDAQAHSWAGHGPATPAQVVLRFVVRFGWLPLAVLTDGPWAWGFMIVLVVDTGMALLRVDRRSATDVLSRTEVATWNGAERTEGDARSLRSS